MGAAEFPQVPLSALGKWADSGAIRAKRNYLRFQRLLSGLGVLGTLLSLWDFPGKRVALSAVLASMAALTLRSMVSTTEKNWYILRALAESIKRVEWRALMGAFDGGPRAADAAVREIWRSLRDDLPPEMRVSAPEVGAEIASAVESLAALTMEEKKSIYRDHRIADQVAWYRGKAIFHVVRWRRIKTLSSLLLAAVLAMAILNSFVSSLVPILLSVVAYATAENALGQNSSVASAYGVAAEELGEILVALDEVPESDWAQFVSDSEEAISREHTSWRASRELKRSGGRGA